MHAVLARKEYGTRSPIKVARIIQDFNPTKIVTLIDDVYLQWHRTQEYASTIEYIGEPTLEQLLQARRDEILLGDLLTKQTTKEHPFPPHYVVAIWHPARVLNKILFGKPSLKMVYMSFPIAAPREALEKKDDSLMKEINEILRKVSDFEAHNPNITFFCPLTIDEKPIVRKCVPEKGKNKDGNEICYNIFDTKERWNVRDFYGKETILLSDGNDLPDKIRIPEEQIKHASGFIEADVPTRDYRLVMQCKHLAVFNPKMGKDVSPGVYNEISLALDNEFPTHVYQNPKYDPERKIKQDLQGRRSEAMGGHASRTKYLVFHVKEDSDEENLKSLLKTLSK
jgi:hypothetical protein